MKAIGVILQILALALAGYGLGVMYEDSYSARIVGGDAYNYMIYAARGTGWICAGIVSAIVGLGCILLDRSEVSEVKS